MRIKVLFAVLMIAILIVPGCSPATKYVGIIAFTSSPEGWKNEIYTILSDGSHESPVTNHSFQQMYSSGNG